jgi:hypothetical protein
MADFTLTAIPDLIGKTAIVTGASARHPGSAGRALYCR